MKKAFILTILLFTGIFSFAGSIEELNEILGKAKNPFVTPEGLDQLMISVRAYQKVPLPDQDAVILEVYRTVTNAYVANNHFKQAYNVFNNYLAYKESMLSKDKAGAISKAVNSTAERSRNDESDKLKMQNQLSELQSDNSKITKKLVFFKSNFTLILIVLSIVFATILVSYGIKAFSLRSRLNENRVSMKSIHHLALTGRYEEGVKNALQQSMLEVEKELSELKLAIK